MRCRHKTKPPRFQAKPPADNPGTPPDPIWDTGRSSLSAGDYSSPARPGGRGETFSRLPRAALPPGALVVVFSPLLDQRFVETLRDMRERGFGLFVVDVLNTVPPPRRTFSDAMTRRIWRMEQQAIRFSLRELGVPVVHWDGEESLDLPLAAHTRRPMAARR